MVYMILPAWLLALIPGLIGGFAKSAMSQGAVNKMNWYNSPASQLRRVMEAGLPAAAFFGGQAGQQAQMPDYSGIGESISNFQITRGQQIQQELLMEQIRKMMADADVSENLRDISNEETLAGLDIRAIRGGIPRTDAYMNKRADYEMKENALGLLKNQHDISTVEKNVRIFLEQNQKDKAKAELDKLLLQLDIGGQAMENERVRTIARNAIIGRMEEGGLSLLEAILIQVMSSIGGGVSNTGANIGF